MAASNWEALATATTRFAANAGRAREYEIACSYADVELVA
jgi:hypothetical protein